MEEKKIFKYIKRLLPYVLILSLVLSFGVNLLMRRQQTYVAAAAINYNYDAAEQGKTPIGTDLDVSEIKSSAILTKAIESLSLSDQYSADKLSARITITAVPDADKEAQKNAKLEDGEDYTYVPTTYIVAFTANSTEGSRFAQTMLDGILDAYFSVFGENYINVDHISNNIAEIYEKDYDYLRMIEYIDDNIENTVNILYQRSSVYPYYRSTEMGVSFDDIIDQFNFIRNVTLRDLYAEIYAHQITKSKGLLNATYETRIEENAISGSNERSMYDDVEEVIEAYLRKMRESGNTNITYEYILDDVHSKDLTDGNGNIITNGDQTVTYDELIYAWRDHDLNDALASIDTAYCRYVLDAFNACRGTCGGICQTSDKTCAALSEAGYATAEAEVQERIREVVDTLSELYNTAVVTNSEYNGYLGCKNITILSSAATNATVNVTLYSVIAFIFIMVVCCGGLILIGRMNDIIIASFYTDRLTGFYNRAYFDKYLQKNSRTIIDDGTVMVSVQITNQRDLNRLHGRSMGDEVIKLFADDLRAVFAKTDSMFVYNGNSHFIVTLNKSDSITAEDALQNFAIYLENRDACEKARIEYTVGVAETFRERVKSARALLVEAIRNAKPYAVEAKAERETAD